MIKSLRINGQDALENLESGETLKYAGGAVTVHFPNKRHPNDPTDGADCGSS